MKTIIYVKVQINSEGNLPEVKGGYIFGWDTSRTVLSHGVYMMPYDPNDYMESKIDLSEYDYWLKPVELPDEEERRQEQKDYPTMAEERAFVSGVKWILNKLK